MSCIISSIHNCPVKSVSFQSINSCEIKKNGQLKKILEKPSMNYLVNIGLYLFKPEIIKIPADLIKIADQALYKAKQEGRNRTIVGKP